MTPEAFHALMLPITRLIADAPVDGDMGAKLNAAMPADGSFVQEIRDACDAAIAAGWMCAQGEGNRKFGRVIQPSPATGNLSVDVVELTDVVGPLHRHPNGEICLILPVTPGAAFDGQKEGWKIYRAGSAHRPTVRGGTARILYLLPDGQIEFQE